jgi:hypothetical protein
MVKLNIISRYNDKYNYWNDVYGFKMSVMKKNLTRDAQVDFCDPKSIISDPVVISDINTETATIQQLDFTSEFKLEIKRDGSVHAFCGWFDIIFDISETGASMDKTVVDFSTSCYNKGTHWKQVSFVLEHPARVKTGDVVEGVFECKKHSGYTRELSVTIIWKINSGPESKQIYNVR